jgi:peptidoglycan hydrolase CwlO-like protein
MVRGSAKEWRIMLSRRHLVLTIVPLICLAFSPRTSGAPRAVNSIVEKVQMSKRKIVEADAEKRRILGSLYVINQRMKKITNTKSQLTDEMFQVQDNVQNLAKIIASLEIEISKQRQQLRRRLRALYKLSGEGYIGTLFSQNNFQALDETMRFLKIVTESDYKLLRTYQTNIAVYKDQREKLKGQIGKLVGIQKRIKQQEGLLAAEHMSKSKIVSALDKQSSANLAQIRNLRSGSVHF